MSKRHALLIWPATVERRESLYWVTASGPRFLGDLCLIRSAYEFFRSVNEVGFGHRQIKKACAILSTMEQQELIEKIKRLPHERV
jgi:hypothetical protein